MCNPENEFTLGKKYKNDTKPKSETELNTDKFGFG